MRPVGHVMSTRPAQRWPDPRRLRSGLLTSSLAWRRRKIPGLGCASLFVSTLNDCPSTALPLAPRWRPSGRTPMINNPSPDDRVGRIPRGRPVRHTWPSFAAENGSEPRANISTETRPRHRATPRPMEATDSKCCNQDRRRFRKRFLEGIKRRLKAWERRRRETRLGTCSAPRRGSVRDPGVLDRFATSECNVGQTGASTSAENGRSKPRSVRVARTAFQAMLDSKSVRDPCGRGKASRCCARSRSRRAGACDSR